MCLFPCSNCIYQSSLQKVSYQKEARFFWILQQLWWHNWRIISCFLLLLSLLLLLLLLLLLFFAFIFLSLSTNNVSFLLIHHLLLLYPHSQNYACKNVTEKLEWIIRVKPSGLNPWLYFKACRQRQIFVFNASNWFRSLKDAASTTGNIEWDG